MSVFSGIKQENKRRYGGHRCKKHIPMQLQKKKILENTTGETLQGGAHIALT
jgi:hypothetical protein